MDQVDFTLTIYRGHRPVRRLPVALGVNDSTPTGLYYIVNKITDPDWYDQGRRTTAGAPENPLGRRWLGLGTKAGATPYGIHGTPALGSLGGYASRGCIRMRPEDVETVFRMCPVGTPVYICPSC